MNAYTCCILQLYVTILSGKDNVWPESEREKNPEEPSYVQSEKDQFWNHKDKDKDGKLNKVYIMYAIRNFHLSWDHKKKQESHLQLQL